MPIVKAAPCAPFKVAADRGVNLSPTATSAAKTSSTAEAATAAVEATPIAAAAAAEGRRGGALFAHAPRLLFGLHRSRRFPAGAIPPAATMLLPAAAGVSVDIAVDVGIVIVADSRGSRLVASRTAYISVADVGRLPCVGVADRAALAG